MRYAEIGLKALDRGGGASSGSSRGKKLMINMFFDPTLRGLVETYRGLKPSLGKGAPGVTVVLL
jgi:hypothetical protein